MNPVLQETVIRFGGVEAFTEAVNGRIRELETQQGIPPERSHGNVHPATVRAWLRGARPRFAVRAQAVCDLAGRTTQQAWGRDTLDDVNRREFLTQAIGGMGATALAGAILPIIAELGAAPDADPEAYTRRSAELWAGCWTAEPVDLAYAAADHAEYGRTLLTRSRGRDRQRIADAVGLTTILVGRAAFFDLGRPPTARDVWNVADRYLTGTADHPLLACLHGHMAFVPGWAGHWDEAEAHLKVAHGYARRGGGPTLRSWLHAVAAECQARSGRTSGALESIERAKETLAAGGAHPDPWWLDYYSVDRLEGFDASVSLTSAQEVLGRPATQRAARHALDRVERALGHLRTTSPHPKTFTPQDCVTTLDRATAYALIHDDDEALRNAEAACKVLGRRPYYAATVRLDTLADILPASKLGQLHEIERAYLGAA